MSITTKKLWELFEVNWMMMRQNPGGTSPYLQGYLLGFAGTINILEAIDASTKVGTVKLKVGNGAVQSRDVNFATSTPEALTPSAAAQALTNAGFTGCTFTVDSETNRLQVIPVDTTVKWIQIYGDVAAALHFGNCHYAEGKGCYLWPSFDGDLKSVAETENWSEDTTIENDSPLGNKVTYTKAGRRSGTQIVITDRLHSYTTKQMVNGGKWSSGDDTTPETYEPPAPDNNDTRRVDVFTYSKVFEKNDNTEGDERFILERRYIGGIGSRKKTGGAGSWSDGEYTLTFGSYVGDDGKEHSSPLEASYTLSQWEAMQLSGVLVMDWENA